MGGPADLLLRAAKGQEVYFSIPVEAEEEDAQPSVPSGTIAYWPPGRALCIFFGPTPASEGPEPQAASPVNPIGRLEGAREKLKALPPEIEVTVTSVD